MKDLLVAAYESMFLSIKNENYRDACKFVVIQAEIISEYLIINHEIINNWIKKDPILIEKYSLQYPDKSTSYLRTKTKLDAASDYSGHIWNPDKFKIVNDIRNYGSHGYHESVLAKHDADVSIVSREYKDFFSEWFAFIKTVEKKLYSDEKRSEYVANQPENLRDFKGKLKLIQGEFGPYGYADNVLIRTEIIKANKWEHGQEIAGKAISYLNKKGDQAWKATN